VLVLPQPDLRMPAGPAVPGALAELVDEALRAVTAVVVRLGPATDLTPLVAALSTRGPTLVVVPSVERAAVLAERLRRAGGGVAVVPEDWAQARAGAAVVVGARGAAWAPCPGLAAVVVVDAHDQALAQEQAPTWNAAEVVAERARRAGVPCLLVSACPGLELTSGRTVLRTTRRDERSGWASIEVVDRRDDDPRLGLYSEALVALVRGCPRVVCVLNRTGRARLLACRRCGEIVRCATCGAAVGERADPSPAAGLPAVAGAGPTGELACRRCGTSRPAFCLVCESTALRRLRIGVTRARQELEALAGRAVGEVTAATGVLPPTEVWVGTEAVLHRVPRADGVAFVDFDQELLAPRYRAAEDALALLARASRLVGGRRRAGGGRVLVQTRLPHHPVLEAAALADPDHLARSELPLRRSLGLPPLRALAAVSGAGAAEFVGTLADRAVAQVEILGPDRDQWLVRAPDHRTLADALAGLARPAGRLRVEVDPLRV
jgi:primosomal protein N' (replication factor Y)